MRIFKKAFTRIGEIILNKKSKSIVRTVKAVNLKQASSIGVVFDATNIKDFNQVKEFIKKISSPNIKVGALGYIPDHRKEYNYLSDKTWFFFSDKECNLFMIPDIETINKFVEMKLDLLLILSIDDHFPIKWISKLSNAGFKAGASGYYGDDLDFMIELKEKSTQSLVEQLSHYLGLLNNIESPKPMA